jgi:hypothetical protein
LLVISKKNKNKEEHSKMALTNVTDVFNKMHEVFMGGQLKAAGDIMLAQRVEQLFPL